MDEELAGRSQVIEDFLQNRGTDEPPSLRNREFVLREAERLITQDRENQYGDPHEHFKEVAQMWSLISGLPIVAEMVPMMMAGLKMVRMKDDPCHPDNAVDLAGYTALTLEVAIKEVGNMARRLKEDDND
jgi:hypothetical protein